MRHNDIVQMWKRPAFTSGPAQDGLQSPVALAILSDVELEETCGGTQYPTDSFHTMACCTTGQGGCTLQTNSTAGCCGEPGSCHA